MFNPILMLEVKILELSPKSAPSCIVWFENIDIQRKCDDVIGELLGFAVLSSYYNFLRYRFNGNVRTFLRQKWGRML